MLPRFVLIKLHKDGDLMNYIIRILQYTVDSYAI